MLQIEMQTEIAKLLNSMVETASGRMKIIETASVEHPENWQSVCTPYDIVREMCDLVPDATHYVVLFAMEFLEVLVKERRIVPENIVFFTDSELECLMASSKKMYGVKSVRLDRNLICAGGFNSDVLANTLKQGLENMKFEKLAVLMNPPYQMDDGGHSRSAKPIYNLFIETMIDDLSPDYMVSINPSRWMIGGKGLDEHRERMMADRRVKVIVDDASSSNIFPSVAIAGGVNYFLWEKTHNDKCLFNGVERFLDEEDIVIRENEARSILAKVKVRCSKWIGSAVSPRKPYGLRSEAEEVAVGVPCWHKQSIGLRIVSPDVVKDPRGDVNTWRVLVPRAPIAGQTDFSKPIGFFNNRTMIIAKPGEYCTETFIVLRTFNNKEEAENFISYIKTRFFRFMLRMRTVSQDITREKYNWVPDVEDYSAPWTDEELYKKYNLTRQEIAYIESKIKEID